MNLLIYLVILSMKKLARIRNILYKNVMLRKRQIQTQSEMLLESTKLSCLKKYFNYFLVDLLSVFGALLF